MAHITVDTLTYTQLAKSFDHALLRPEMTTSEVVLGCNLAARYDVKSVCVKPCDVRLAAETLAGTSVLVGTVISFPHGNSPTSIKIAESLQAIDDGATELDVVINIGLLRGGEVQKVEDEVRAVVQAAKKRYLGVLIKVIFENAYLSREEIVLACKLTERAGAEFVKTSTGFAATGHTIEDLRLMRESVSERIEVKASGGVKTLDQVVAILQTGTTRVGSSSTDKILDEFKRVRGL
ncbi:deoxyribose-phosphate aldolase [Jimgerdemannia flammicorona]|uniref:deoxyribose-phosphate aldolase n=1 Tax=Jimgerdemannia flammicorona TaxID=994334 RepID=A0A433DIJ6_9FUNG|nr:deoxyribose-phosphate aldolase [Jimgerdemannia flammicorona]